MSITENKMSVTDMISFKLNVTLVVVSNHAKTLSIGQFPRR